MNKTIENSPIDHIDTNKKDWYEAKILRVGVFGGSKSRLLRFVAEVIEGGSMSKRGGKEVESKKGLIFTPNLEILTLAEKNVEFKKVLQAADVNIPDGAGVVLASRIKKLFSLGRIDQSISTRLTGIDMMEEMVRLAAERGWKVYLLGGEEDEAEVARHVYWERYATNSSKGFEITSNPGADIKKASEDQWKAVRESINAFTPDLLFVAFGAGNQEPWLVENKEKLNFKIGMGVGGAFNFVAGKSKRAPKIMREAGFEWLWRLMTEPWRWKRQLRLFKFWGYLMQDVGK